MEPQQLLNFINPRLGRAIRDDDEFNRVIGVLHVQHAQRGSNTLSRVTPITWIVREEDLDHAACVRSATLIELLYKRCGIPITCSAGEDGYGYSDLYRAACYLNFPAFETLLTKCAAKFITDIEEPMRAFFCYLDCYNVLPYLKLLRTRGHRLDANQTFFNGSTPLQVAIGYPYHARTATDPNPDLVRFLIDELGANTTVKNRKGQTPLEELIENENLPPNKPFKSDAAWADWRRRVDETKRILERGNFAAFAMANHIRLGENSDASQLGPDMIAKITKHSGAI